ncbi:MAG: PAS domain-containing protein [Alphaproteobacteria bacterium]|nr:PAS domain-containing protein [Alphaproteobacteria bacterium]
MDELRIVARRLPLDDIAEASLAHVHRLWVQRRGARPMPAPGEMLPEEFGVALGKVNLVEVLRDPLRFVFRVRGTVIASLHNSTMTGRDVREMEPPAYRDMLLGHYEEAVSESVPTYYHIKQSRGEVWNEYHRIILPLGTAEGTVERLLTASAWGPDFVEKGLQLGFKER